MGRRAKEPLRPFTEQERQALVQIARSGSEQADVVARAKEVLAVAAGRSYEEAAAAAGRRSYEAVSELMHPGRSTAYARPAAGRHRHLVVNDLAARLAQSPGRAAACQHLHHLPSAA